MKCEIGVVTHFVDDVTRRLIGLVRFHYWAKRHNGGITCHLVDMTYSLHDTNVLPGGTTREIDETIRQMGVKTRCAGYLTRDRVEKKCDAGDMRYQIDGLTRVLGGLNAAPSGATTL